MTNNNEEIEKKSYLNNNETLLISEIQNKVILPYTFEEIKKIFEENKNKFESEEEVIEKIYTKPLSTYRFQFLSRYNETIKLMTERENYNYLDAVALGIELLPKKFLHPAIITACRDINELYVYLDCLDKNELDDFKIFNIKYEIYPMVINNQTSLFEKVSMIDKIMTYLKNLLNKAFKLNKKSSNEE